MTLYSDPCEGCGWCTNGHAYCQNETCCALCPWCQDDPEEDVE